MLSLLNEELVPCQRAEVMASNSGRLLVKAAAVRQWVEAQHVRLQERRRVAQKGVWSLAREEAARWGRRAQAAAAAAPDGPRLVDRVRAEAAKGTRAKRINKAQLEALHAFMSERQHVSSSSSAEGLLVLPPWLCKEWAALDLQALSDGRAEQWTDVLQFCLDTGITPKQYSTNARKIKERKHG